MLRLGSVVGDYRLESEIGRGSFGKVYKARSLRDETVVALKLVPLIREDEVSAERLGALLQQRFERDCGMVPRTFEPGWDEHYFYIPMECIDAPTLMTVMRGGPLNATVAVHHAISICRFLERAHSFATEIEGVNYKRIVHADLKPEHVFILSDGAIKVLDFGIAKALETAKVETVINWVTPHYASPRRLDTSRANEMDDMWALGVILYEMVSGHRPHSQIEDPYPHTRLRHAIEMNEPRERLPASCPRGLQAVINKLLAFQGERRYESAAAIRQDLEACLRQRPPRALREFVTAETIKAPPTARSGNGHPNPVPQTVPRPVERVSDRAGSAEPIAPGVATMASGRTPFGRRAAWAATLMVLTGLFTTEAVAWMGAERMRRALATLDGRGVMVKRQEYERLLRWSVLHLGPRLRLNAPLKERLVSVAEAVIADFREEEPTVASAQWRQASEALGWATRLAPTDASLLPKQLDCDAHVDRIAGQSQVRVNATLANVSFKRAIEKFRRSADLAPASPDPYLGLSRVYIYGLDSVDEGAAAIREAEKRGHKPGRRERAQLGDGYLRRAEKTRKSKVPAEERRKVLENARDDYRRCIDFFSPIVGFGRAAQNLEFCQRHLDAANRGLESDFFRQP